ncbi:MAG: hypothetical protein AAFO82_15745 [Bacteroidota bacterium]
MDTVSVEVEVAQGANVENRDFNQQLKAKIKNTIGLSMDVQLKQPNSIPRSQGGKLSRILDKRK